MDPSETESLLAAWQDHEDREALGRLLERDLAWIEERVRRRLGPALRGRAETHDFVQEAALEFLRYGPKVRIGDREHLRALLARIAENAIRGEVDRAKAARRDRRRERRLATNAPLFLDSKSPSDKAAEAEMNGLVELGLEFLSPEDRQVVLARERDGLDFRSIGQTIGVSENAARMRTHRALARLGEIVRRLGEGELAAILADLEEAK